MGRMEPGLGHSKPLAPVCLSCCSPYTEYARLDVANSLNVHGLPSDHVRNTCSWLSHVILAVCAMFNHCNVVSVVCKASPHARSARSQQRGMLLFCRVRLARPALVFRHL